MSRAARGTRAQVTSGAVMAWRAMASAVDAVSVGAPRLARALFAGES